MKRALLIIDIQNDYFEGGTNPLTGSYEASEKARMLLEEFRVNNLPVIHVQHLAARPTASFFLPGTVGAEIHPNVKPLENVVVIGAGTMGLLNAQVAKLFGARVIITELTPKKITRAQSLKSVEVIDAKQNDPVSEVLKITQGAKKDGK